MDSADETPQSFLPVGLILQALLSCCRSRGTASLDSTSIYTLFCTTFPESGMPDEVIHTSILNGAHLEKIMQMKEF
jgi:hypothetical protein